MLSDFSQIVWLIAVIYNIAILQNGFEYRRDRKRIDLKYQNRGGDHNPLKTGELIRCKWIRTYL